MVMSELDILARFVARKLFALWLWKEGKKVMSKKLNKTDKRVKVIVYSLLMACIAIGGLAYDKSVSDKMERLESKNSELLSVIGESRSREKKYVETLIEYIAPEYDIPVNLAKAVIYNRSGFYNHLRGYRNHVGVAALTAADAKVRGLTVNKEVDERYDVEKVLKAEFDFINKYRTLVKETKGIDDVEIAIALTHTSAMEDIRDYLVGDWPENADITDNSEMRELKRLAEGF